MNGRFRHLDLFSGIGGFAYAAQAVWGERYECAGFCEIDKFCQADLRKNWPGIPIIGDIRELNGLLQPSTPSDSEGERCGRGASWIPRSEPNSEGWPGVGDESHDGCGKSLAYPQSQGQLCEGQREDEAVAVGNESGCGLSDCGGGCALADPVSLGHLHGQHEVQPAVAGLEAFGEPLAGVGASLLHGRIDLLTGGFPCQPFSHAGKRRGTDDGRFLWPAMLECIRFVRPRWVIAENVYGLLSIEGGMVFEQVCLGLEAAGYEVWPLVIPACAVNAPHRRDRIWIVGKRIDGDSCGKGLERFEREMGGGQANVARPGEGWDDASNSEIEGLAGDVTAGHPRPAGCFAERFDSNAWNLDRKQVASATCVRGVDDGIPRWLDGVRISESAHRRERLKMLGNSIVPQVAMRIIAAMRDTDEAEKEAEG